MTYADIVADLNTSLAEYQRRLTAYPEAAFQQPGVTEEGSAGWSAAQVYEHHLMTHRHFFVPAMEAIFAGENAEQATSELGLMILAKNRIGRRKFDRPPAFKAFGEPENRTKAAIQADWATLTRQSLRWAERIGQDQPTGRYPHPAFGFYNGQEMLHTLAIHLRHHFRQLDELAQ